MEKKTRNITVLSLATLGLICVGSGSILTFSRQENEKVATNSGLVYSERIKLTPVMQTVKVNQTLPSRLRDYIKESLNDEIIDKIKLDTSKVDISKAGTYEYTLSYKSQVFKGMVVVEDLIVTKEETNLNTELTKITLKDIVLYKGESLPTDISNYIIEPLDPVTAGEIQFALPTPNITMQTGTYTYNVTFHNMVYTGTITVQENQALTSKPEVIEKDEDPSTIIVEDTNKQNNTTKQP